MSFGINEPYRAKSGPDTPGTGSREPDRGRFELTVGPSSIGRKPTVGKAPTVATCAIKGAGSLSLFAAPVRQNNQNSQNEPGMSLGINQIVNRGAEEGACPLKNKDLLTIAAPDCESSG